MTNTNFVSAFPDGPQAACTSVTSASWHDGIDCRLPLVARRPAPHRLRILLLKAVRSRDSRSWFSVRHASVHRDWSLLASVPEPIFPSGATFSGDRFGRSGTEAAAADRFAVASTA